MAEDGDVLRFDGDGWPHRRQDAHGPRADRRHAGRRSGRRGPARSPPHRHRRPGRAGGGHQHAQTGIIEGVPELVARGFVTDADTADVLAEGAKVLADIIDECGLEERTDPGLMKERIRDRTAAVPEEAHGTAPDGAARRDGNLATRGRVSKCSQRGDEWWLLPVLPYRVASARSWASALFAGALDLADRAGQLRPERPRLVLQHGHERRPGEFRRTRRRVPRRAVVPVARLRLLPDSGDGRRRGLALFLVPRRSTRSTRR